MTTTILRVTLLVYYYRSTPRTTYRLVHPQPRTATVPRLPPLIADKSAFLRIPISPRCSGRGGIALHGWNCHNNTPDHLPPQTLLHHCIGTQADHHAVTALQAAAAAAGRHCVVVPGGLAAAAHFWNEQQSAQQRQSRRDRGSTSWPDCSARWNGRRRTRPVSWWCRSSSRNCSSDR